MLFVIGIWFAGKWYYAQVPNKRSPFVLTEKRNCDFNEHMMSIVLFGKLVVSTVRSSNKLLVATASEKDNLQ